MRYEISDTPDNACFVYEDETGTGSIPVTKSTQEDMIAEGLDKYNRIKHQEMMLNQHQTKQLLVPDISGTLDIPDSWDSCYEFGKWWFDNKMPIMIPTDYRVYCSDDATSICLFRHKQFQIEMYLIFPDPNLPVHEHPGVEVIKTRLNLYENNKLAVQQHSSGTLFTGQSHGAGINFKELDVSEKSGFPLVAIQKWDDGLTPTTVASRWKGHAVGPKHIELVKNENSNAHIDDNYIDVTMDASNNT